MTNQQERLLDRLHDAPLSTALLRDGSLDDAYVGRVEALKRMGLVAFRRGMVVPLVNGERKPQTPEEG